LSTLGASGASPGKAIELDNNDENDADYIDYNASESDDDNYEIGEEELGAADAPSENETLHPVCLFCVMVRNNED
jgi:hypothetical protein